MLVPRVLGAGPDPRNEAQLLDSVESQKIGRADEGDGRTSHRNAVVETVPYDGGRAGPIGGERVVGHGIAFVAEAVFAVRIERSRPESRYSVYDTDIAVDAAQPRLPGDARSMPIDLANPLVSRAVTILRENDTGSSTKPAPALYPHMWSWDSALIAIGIAQYSVERAAQEMRSLMRGQWKNGMIPQIQFNPGVPPEAYFPDAGRWDVHAVSTDAPEGVATSGIIQPPVHAIAVRAICDLADRYQARALAREFYEPLREWHRYLMSARDPEVSGLVTIVHPWESGMDNSPRWDRALARIEVPEGELPPFTRRDLAHVSDPSQRPTDDDYRRYM